MNATSRATMGESYFRIAPWGALPPEPPAGGGPDSLAPCEPSAPKPQPGLAAAGLDRAAARADLGIV